MVFAAAVITSRPLGLAATTDRALSRVRDCLLAAAVAVILGASISYRPDGGAPA